MMTPINTGIVRAFIVRHSSEFAETLQQVRLKPDPTDFTRRTQAATGIWQASSVGSGLRRTTMRYITRHHEPIPEEGFRRHVCTSSSGASSIRPDFNGA